MFLFIELIYDEESQKYYENDKIDEKCPPCKPEWRFYYNFHY